MTDFSHIAPNRLEILNLIAKEAAAVGRRVPRLVAVSKLFPAEAVLVAYREGQRHFGENYIQELLTKSEVLKNDCPEIRWHFIGRIQSNKIKQLASVHNLAFVETIESVSHAAKLQKEFEAVQPNATLPSIFMQINTSGEEGKGGIALSDVHQVAKDISEQAARITLAGVMTIGSVSESKRDDGNDDFKRLIEARNAVATAIGKSVDELELSMGMSSDYLEAIRSGSTNVRIGSSIFGARPKKN